jgi:glycosyltransferase involved in cell wall biosynthesis
MLLSEGRESEVSLTGKIFEYLGLRKPILGVVGAGEVESLLEGEQGCWLARPSDAGAVAEAIAEVHGAWRDGDLPRPSRELTERFSRSAQADEYLALLDEVIRERSASRQA